MNIKHLLLAAATVFVALNFMGCKDDAEEMSIEEKI